MNGCAISSWFFFGICHIIICEYMRTHMLRTRICLQEKWHRMPTHPKKSRAHTHICHIYWHLTNTYTCMSDQLTCHVCTYIYRRYGVTCLQIRWNSEHKHICSIYSYVRNTQMSTGDISPHAYKYAEILSMYTCVTRTLMSQIHMYLQEICHHMHTNTQKSRAILWYRISNYIQRILWFCVRVYFGQKCAIFCEFLFFLCLFSCIGSWFWQEV